MKVKVWFKNSWQLAFCVTGEFVSLSDNEVVLVSDNMNSRVRYNVVDDNELISMEFVRDEVPSVQ